MLIQELLSQIDDVAGKPVTLRCRIVVTADDMPVPSFGPRGVHPLQTIGRRRAAELAGAAGARSGCRRRFTEELLARSDPA